MTTAHPRWGMHAGTAALVPLLAVLLAGCGATSIRKRDAATAALRRQLDLDDGWAWARRRAAVLLAARGAYADELVDSRLKGVGPLLALRVLGRRAQPRLFHYLGEGTGGAWHRDGRA
jgi:hypothetical protein